MDVLGNTAWVIIAIAILVFALAPKAKGDFGTDYHNISGPVWFIVLMIGVLMLAANAGFLLL